MTQGKCDTRGWHLTVSEHLFSGLDERISEENIVWICRTVELADVPVVCVGRIDYLFLMSYVTCFSPVTIAEKENRDHVPITAESFSTIRAQFIPTLVLMVS